MFARLALSVFLKRLVNLAHDFSFENSVRKGYTWKKLGHSSVIKKILKIVYIFMSIE